MLRCVDKENDSRGEGKSAMSHFTEGSWSAEPLNSNPQPPATAIQGCPWEIRLRDPNLICLDNPRRLAPIRWPGHRPASIGGITCEVSSLA